MMPLTRRQFELGVDTETENWMRRIYGFLSENNHLAYTTEELFEEVAHNDSSVSTVFQRAMEALQVVWAVEARIVRGTRYVAHVRDVDTSTWVPILEPQGSSASSETG